MADSFEFTISGEYAGLRLDSVLSLLLEDVSRSYIQKLIEGGNVQLNGRNKIKKNTLLKEKDFVTLEMPPAIPCDAQPEDIPLDIVYEDSDIIVVNKPKGMVVHPAAGNLNGTLVNALLFHCGALSTINGTQRPGIVHRIDKDTSGLLVCAKSDAAYKCLQVQFAEHSITRLYQGVCCFGFDKDKGTVDAPLGRDPKNRLRMAICEDGKRAVTHWKVLERFNGFTEIEAKLETGRTHQIRVHMASVNHPLLGDSVYGASKQPYKLEGQMLHAKVLGFIHPVSGQYMEFEALPPKEYSEVIEKLRNRQ